MSSSLFPNFWIAWLISSFAALTVTLGGFNFAAALSTSFATLSKLIFLSCSRVEVGEDFVLGSDEDELPGRDPQPDITNTMKINVQ
jgi:hypothetical protein